MCTIALALTIASTAVGAVSSIGQGMAAMQAAKYNNQIAQMNAKVEERRAQDALDRGRLEEQKQRMANASIYGKQIAAMGANNVDVSFGSPLEIIADTHYLGEMDALIVRTNAARESYDHRVQAENYRAQGQLSLMEGKSKMTGGFLSAFGTALGGASDAWGKYQQSLGIVN